MERATAFYVNALGATVAFASPGWSSLRIAGVRVGLALNPMHEGGRTGLHFAVSDLVAARSDVQGAGGRTGEAVEVAPKADPILSADACRRHGVEVGAPGDHTRGRGDHGAEEEG